MKEMIKSIIREEMFRSMKNYYFISGLPRSGSTLLSAILNQNPNFHSSPSSPVLSSMIGLEQFLSNDEFFNLYPKPQQAAKMISSMIDNYYSDVEEPVIFDRNNSWILKNYYIQGYFGIEPKILCPVRDINEILASFITLCRENPYNQQTKINFIDEFLIKNNIQLTDENRCEFLTSSNGILGYTYNNLRQLLMDGNQNFIHFIEYNDLVENPENTMRKVYEFLNIEYYNHDFSNITYNYDEKNLDIYGLPNKHNIKSELKKDDIKVDDVLPEEIIEKFINSEFWRDIDKDYIPEVVNEEPITEYNYENSNFI